MNGTWCLAQGMVLTGVLGLLAISKGDPILESVTIVASWGMFLPIVGIRAVGLPGARGPDPRAIARANFSSHEFEGQLFGRTMVSSWAQLVKATV